MISETIKIMDGEYDLNRDSFHPLDDDGRSHVSK